jgi:hypothetical protein
VQSQESNVEPVLTIFELGLVSFDFIEADTHTNPVTYPERSIIPKPALKVANTFTKPSAIPPKSMNDVRKPARNKAT